MGQAGLGKHMATPLQRVQGHQRLRQSRPRPKYNATSSRRQNDKRMETYHKDVENVKYQRPRVLKRQVRKSAEHGTGENKSRTSEQVCANNKPSAPVDRR